MKLYNLCIGLATLGIISCSTENNLENSENESIKFSAGIGNFTSRVANNQWEGGEIIGVSIGEQTKAYHITASGEMSTEDPYLWDDTPVDIKAWTPLTDEEISLTDQSTEEKFYNCDFLACQTKAESANVQLAFNHQMTKMEYMLQTHTGYTDEEAKQAKVYFMGYGAVTYSQGTIATTGEPNQLISTWSTADFNGTALLAPCEMWGKPLIRVEIGGDVYVYTPQKEVNSDNQRNTGVLVAGARQQYFLQVSKTGLQVTMQSSSVDWDNETIGNEGIADSKFKVVIPEEISKLTKYSLQGIETNDFITDAEEGFSITYKKSETSDGIDFEGMCDRKRTVNTEANTVTFSFTNIHSDIKLAYMPEYMEVGYYFYNDGTYGDTYKDNAVGIIYKIGAHNTDNVANYAGTTINTIHGYVVALDDEKNDSEISTFKWKEGNGTLLSNNYPESGIAGGNTSKYIGYQNTKYLIEQAATQADTKVPAVATSTAKNSPNVINGTSGWYLPSHTQLKDLESLAGISKQGYTALDGTYWDSSFDSKDYAYIVVFGNGTISSANFYRAVDSEQKVRLILTF
ncbi:fimbrillin family protein [Bacteroides mediterraneensis]|uniref:fimbrillin family protein n=1 Tax=Bacteroides mediterraneensis TaxID=1841856 RepID=UPI0026F19921|nr:fimbrillin family protein [Bacteroides mediterraneensis]